MPMGWRPTHPGEPTPEWGRFGRTGCIVFVTIVIAIMMIAALIGATGTRREAEVDAHGGATSAGTALLIAVALDTSPPRRGCIVHSTTEQLTGAHPLPQD